MGGDHIWVDTNASGDFCYVGEADCLVSVRCARDSVMTFMGCRVSNNCVTNGRANKYLTSEFQRKFIEYLCFQKVGPRRKCAACKILVHSGCMTLLHEKVSICHIL